MQGGEQMATQLHIGITHGRGRRVEVMAQVLLQVLGILDRVHQLQRCQLAADPELLVRFIHGQLHASHETQQIAIHALDMYAIQVIGLEPTMGGLGLQQMLIAAHTRQLIHRQVERMADHFQTQATQVPQLLHHRAGGRIHRVQRPLIEVTGTGKLGFGHLLRQQLGDQHRRFDTLRQPANQPLRQTRL